jgi:hypothetical protein
VPGPHRLEFALRLAPAGAADAAAEALRFAAPALALPGRLRATAGAPLRDGSRLVEIDDPAVLLSALEPRAEGGARLRLWNASSRARTVRVRLGGEGAGALRPVDLRDAPDPRTPARADGDALVLELRPWQLASLLAGLPA